MKKKINDFDRKRLIMASTERVLPKWDHRFSYDEYNIALEIAGYASHNHSFKEEVFFKIEEDSNKSIIFEICYGDLVANRRPYFFTMVNSKDKGNQGFLPEGTVVRAFWEKWNIYQFKTLTVAEYKELLSDLKIVKADPLVMNEEA